MRNRRYVQVQCGRDLTAANSFGNGQQYFKFTVEEGQRFEPARSFLQLKTALTKVGGAQLTIDDGITFACDPVACAYQAVEMRAMGKPIAKYESGFVAQSDVLLKRLRLSKGRMSLLNQTEWMDPNLDNRINRVTADGMLQSQQALGYVDLGYTGAQTIAIAATGVVTFAGAGIQNTDVNWRAGDVFKYSNGGAINYYQVASVPAAALTMQLTQLSATSYPVIGATAISTNFFWRIRSDIAEAITGTDLTWEFGQMLQSDVTFGPGNYELLLTPYPGTSWKTHMVESRTAKTAGADYDVTISNGYFWISIVDAPTADGSELSMIEQVVARTFNYPASTTRNDLRYDVEPFSRALTVALQAASAGTVTTRPASKFIVGDGSEKTLNRFNIQYKNQNSNQPEIDPSYKSGNLYDYRQEFYRKCMLNSGRWFDPSGCEDFSTFGGASSSDYGLGQYYYHEFHADPKNLSGSAIVTAQFASAPTSAVQIVFSHVTRRVVCTYSKGRMVDVSVEDYSI